MVGEYLWEGFWSVPQKYRLSDSLSSEGMHCLPVLIFMWDGVPVNFASLVHVRVADVADVLISLGRV